MVNYTLFDKLKLVSWIEGEGGGGDWSINIKRAELYLSFYFKAQEIPHQTPWLNDLAYIVFENIQKSN